jgi:ElaB/YqjD/DUF883 family membrane-anchored ribosome-binding protein
MRGTSRGQRFAKSHLETEATFTYELKVHLACCDVCQVGRTVARNSQLSRQGTFPSQARWRRESSGGAFHGQSGPFCWTMDDIQRDLQAVRDDMSRLAQQVASLLSATGSQALREVKAQMSRAKQGLDGVLSEASDKGMEAVDTMRESTDTMLETLEDAVRQRPFATLAIAVGLGFLFGASWRR